MGLFDLLTWEIFRGVIIFTAILLFIVVLVFGVASFNFVSVGLQPIAHGFWWILTR